MSYIEKIIALAKSEGFTCTDMDAMQFCKSLGDRKFEFREWYRSKFDLDTFRNKDFPYAATWKSSLYWHERTIDLNAVGEEEIESVCEEYDYDPISIEDDILAECIFEYRSPWY